MHNWPYLSEQDRMARSELSKGRLPMVLDTDTYNEVDDQFALVYSLLSPERLDVQAVYAAPFLNERSASPKDGMEKSHGEIIRLLDAMGRTAEGFLHKGADRFMQGPADAVDCAAARDLVRRAMARPEDAPLVVVSIGAVTNIAAALLIEPAIVRRIHLVWLGGHALYWPDTREFNLRQDIHAARVVFDSGVPMTLVPCMGVASHAVTSVPELEACIGGKNAVCDALVATVKDYSPGYPGWGKPLWDVVPIGLLINAGWGHITWEKSPLITDDCRWAADDARHKIRVAQTINRNAIFRDMFAKLAHA